MKLTTPRRVEQWALVGIAVGLPAAAAILTLYAAGLMMPQRPVLVGMMFTLAALVATVGAVLWAAAQMHLSVGRAFAAGMVAASEPPAHPSQREEPTTLRVVE